jgi:tRNA U54 and U55 pseudouridine synthase Pus10
MEITFNEREQLIVTALCDGGLYVKELVSGDNGRTSPNLAEKLGIPAKVQDLDVIEVEAPRNEPSESPERSEPE